MATFHDSIKVSRKEVFAVVNATFPNYKGRKFRIQPAEAVGFYDLNWSGGTRNQYRACAIDGSPIDSKYNLNSPAPWNNPFEGKRIELPMDVVIVEHSMFCGKDVGLRIYVNPANMPRLLATTV